MDEPKTVLSPSDRERLEKIETQVRELLGDAMPAPQEGYYMTSRVFGDKIHVYLMRDGKLVASGFSRVNPHEPVSDRTMAQAFSYAAHMAYKHTQWLAEFEPPESVPSPDPIS